jgi:hypothetical protein
MKLQLEIKIAEEDLLTGLQEALAIMKAVNLPVQSVKIKTGFDTHRWITLKAVSDVTDVIKIYKLEKEVAQLQDILLEQVNTKHKAESLTPEAAPFFCEHGADGLQRCDYVCEACDHKGKEVCNCLTPDGFNDVNCRRCGKQKNYPKLNEDGTLPEFFCGDEMDGGAARCEKQCVCCRGVKLKS